MLLAVAMLVCGPGNGVPAHAEMLLDEPAHGSGERLWQPTALDLRLARGCLPDATDHIRADVGDCAAPARAGSDRLGIERILAILGNGLDAFFADGIDPGLAPGIAALAELPSARRLPAVRTHWIDARTAMEIWRVEDRFLPDRKTFDLTSRGALGPSRMGNDVEPDALGAVELGWFRLPSGQAPTWGYHGLIGGEPAGPAAEDLSLAALAPRALRVPTLPLDNANDAQSPVFGPADFVAATPIVFRLLDIEHQRPEPMP